MSKPIKVLSLGAGVQSSTLALLAECGGYEKPDCAIFSDTENEPRYSRTLDPATGEWIEGGIYGFIEWLRAHVSFPVYTVTRGNLFDAACEVKRSRKSGNLYMKGLVPAFVKAPGGSTGLLGRKCTADYKIVPIQRKVKELCSVRRGGKDVICEMWIGISTDEVIRMKPSRVPYIRHEWPLIDMGMSRRDCLNWMSENGYPIPPRSACVGCPFHGDAEWKNLRDNSPWDFEQAVTHERNLQAAAAAQTALKGVPYLHSSCVPLDQVNFGEIGSYGQIDLFGNECEGMCGV